jgi:hypothetical protein
MRERAEKAEAEVAFWKSKAYEAEDREGKLESEVERLKDMVRAVARKGDELLEPYRIRAEKSEALIKQIQAFVEALNQTNK